MKKIIVLAAFAILGISASSFAGTSGPQVPLSVARQFTQQFDHAMDVKWEAGSNFYKATFADWGKVLFAFYADNGDFLGVATNLSSTVLPAKLKTEIKRSYGRYWITDLFGYHNKDGQGFVITLENADRVLVLKADGNDGWSVYKSTVKA